MRTGRAGFTLLEILLALGMMAMLSASLYASLHIAFEARKGAEALLEPVRSAQLALDLVGRELVGALPPKGILAGTFVGTDEQSDTGADADTMVFFTSANDALGRPAACDVSKVELALTKDDDGTTVLVQGTTMNLLAAETPEPDAEVLCRGVQSLNLSYFDGSDWLDAWDSTQHDDELPLAIEVTLVLQPDQRASDQESGYALSRILTLPCASRPQEGNVIIRSTGR